MTPAQHTDAVAIGEGLPVKSDRAPLLTLNADRSPIFLGLIETWRQRELFYFLVWRDLKVRYRQTALGVAWVVLQPLLMALVFTVFFSRLGHFDSGGIPYPVFAYAGLLPWTFFANSVSTGSSSLLANSYILTKVYFPRLLIPLSVVAVRFVDLLVASLVLFVLMPFYGMGLGRNILLLPAMILITGLFALAVSAWLSIVSVRLRDVGTLLPVLIQLWMFLSPIIYPATFVPARWRALYSLNPLVGIIEGFRAAFLGVPFEWNSIIVAAVLTAGLLIYVVYVFFRWEDRIIDKL